VSGSPGSANQREANPPTIQSLLSHGGTLVCLSPRVQEHLLLLKAIIVSISFLKLAFGTRIGSPTLFGRKLWLAALASLAIFGILWLVPSSHGKSSHVLVQELTMLLEQQQVLLNKTEAEVMKLRRSDPQFRPLSNVVDERHHGKAPPPTVLLDSSGPICLEGNCPKQKPRTTRRPSSPTTIRDPYFDSVSEKLSKLRVTYESCSALLRNASSPKLLLKPHWLHFPKAGLGLGPLLYGYLCTSPLGAPSGSKQVHPLFHFCILSLCFRIEPLLTISVPTVVPIATGTSA
jgi:hypothetical protein